MDIAKVTYHSTDYAEMFPDYTKEEDPYVGEQWNDIIHNGPAYSEREDVHKVGEAMKAFLMKAWTWDMERKTYFEKHGLSEDEIFGEGEFLSYSRDFNAKFQGEVDERLVHECIRRYLTEVQRIVTLVERLFSNDQQGAMAEVETGFRAKKLKSAATKRLSGRDAKPKNTDTA